MSFPIPIKKEHMELKDCFREDFSIWLNNSNHPKIKPYITHQSKLNVVVEESLQDIVFLRDIKIERLLK